MTEIVKDPLTIAECIAWIEALRSGEYEQGTGQMCKTGANGSKTYCCLGVANVIFDLKLNAEQAVLTENEEQTDEYIKLPYHTQEKLYRMNDSEKQTFKEIANYIEDVILPTLED